MDKILAWLLETLGLRQPIHYIGGSDTLPPPLSREREAELLARLGEEPARQELIEHNLRLVVYIARRFENTGINIEDLISIGTIGLIKAISTYRMDKNIKLATYASRCIENEILMYFRGRKKSSQDVSLSDYIETGSDGGALSLMDVVCQEDDLLDQVDHRENARRLRRAVDACLTPQERDVICMRYGIMGYSPSKQREVAQQLDISRSYVSRIEKRALEKLRQELETL